MRLLRSAMAAGIGLILAASAALAEGVRHTININGVERAYVVYEPDVRASPTPLVFALHGGSGTPEGFVGRTNLDDMANAMGAVLIAPEGLNGFWRYGGDMPFRVRRLSGDDPAFFAALGSSVIPALGTDPSQVECSGISAGGIMCYRIACERLGGITLSSIAPVAATMNVTSCPYAAGVSVYHQHGLDDAEVPYNGGNGLRPVYEGLNAFYAANGCAPPIERTQVTPDSVQDRYHCSGGREVTRVLVTGGGHEWFYPPSIDSTAAIRAFFERH